MDRKNLSRRIKTENEDQKHKNWEEIDVTKITKRRIFYRGKKPQKR